MSGAMTMSGNYVRRLGPMFALLAAIALALPGARAQSASGVASLALQPASVFAGESVAGTVQLDGPAGPAGATVSLAASPPGVSLPPSIFIPPGASSGVFGTVASEPPGVQQSFAITATLGGSSQSATLTVLPTIAVLSTVTLAPADVVSGQPSTGTVTLAGAVPGASVVTLASNNAAATVPPSVTIPANASSATFPVSTASGLTAVTRPRITATLNGGSRAATLTIRPLTLGLSFSPPSVLPGEPASGTVSLSAPAATVQLVTLGTSSSAIVVPASVTIPAGAQSASFAVETPGAGIAATQAVVTATLGALTATGSITVGGPALRLAAPTVASPGSVEGTIHLGRVAAAPTAVTIEIVPSGAASAPASVTVPAGADRAVVTITAATVSVPSPVTVFATIDGSVFDAPLTVTPATTTPPSAAVPLPRWAAALLALLLAATMLRARAFKRR